MTLLTQNNNLLLVLYQWKNSWRVVLHVTSFLWSIALLTMALKPRSMKNFYRLVIAQTSVCLFSDLFSGTGLLSDKLNDTPLRYLKSVLLFFFLLQKIKDNSTVLNNDCRVGYLLECCIWRRWSSGISFNLYSGQSITLPPCKAKLINVPESCFGLAFFGILLFE